MPVCAALADQAGLGKFCGDSAPPANESTVLSGFTAASTASSLKSSPLIKRPTPEIINTEGRKLERFSWKEGPAEGEPESWGKPEI